MGHNRSCNCDSQVSTIIYCLLPQKQSERDLLSSQLAVQVAWNLSLVQKTTGQEEGARRSCKMLARFGLDQASVMILRNSKWFKCIRTIPLVQS